MGELFHSVNLDTERCKGCTTCIKKCPTEAIRVRNGKAYIISERCIDCGQCIRSCPHHAKRALADPWEMTERFKYKIALPAPALYGQFSHLDDINYVLTGLIAMGFDDVFEVARAAEMLSDRTRRMMRDKEKRTGPIISSACPACVRLIKKRFPGLCDNVLPHAAPVELAAILARRFAAEQTGYKPEEIGVFFISPCPAKITAAKSPVGFERPVIDGAFSMSDIYKKLVGAMNRLEDCDQLNTSGLIGIGWALSGGESAALLSEQYLAVDGIENVIKVLEDVEDGRIPEIEFIELNACTQGCVGGCLTVENPYVAKTRIKRLMKFLPVSRNKADAIEKYGAEIEWEKTLTYTPMWQLDRDVKASIDKMSEIEQLTEELPGLDCGSCGTPSCRAFAEDVILGFASMEDCIFKMRERVQYMSGTGDGDEYLPPPFRTHKTKGDGK